MGRISREKPKSMIAKEIGLVKKMAALQSAMIRDWRRAFSIIGPKTKARTSGAAS